MHREDKFKNVTSVNMLPIRQAIWGDIWKHKVKKSQTNATSQYISSQLCNLRNTFENTLEKNQTNVTNVALHPFLHIIWGCIWRHTVEKSQTKCNHCDFSSAQAGNLRTHFETHRRQKTNVTSDMITPENTIWKNCTNATCEAIPLHVQTIWDNSGEKSNKCSQCNYASSWAGNLRMHLKTHSGEKSNKCD